MRKIKDLLSNVDKEKSDRIINSAMKEFSKNTFEKASTNIIVEDADISKGLLFHYFGSKQNLYKYLEHFTISIFTNELINKLNWEQKDIFLRLNEIAIIKFKIFQKYPYIADFSLKVFQDKTIEDIFKINSDFPMDMYSQIYTYNIDYTLFKEDIDIKKALDIIRWTLEKYSEEMRRNLEAQVVDFDHKKIQNEMYEYIDMLKACFYRSK